MSTDFTRQRKPVHVMLTGDPDDVDFYRERLIFAIDERFRDRAERSQACKGIFKIIPRGCEAKT